MATLSQIMGEGSPTESRNIFTDKRDYDEYATNVATRGGTPMTFAEWIKAGKPSK